MAPKKYHSPEEERQMLMYGAMPGYSTFWDENFNKVDCNRGAVDLFGLKDKQEYLDRWGEFWPEYQPDGKLSSDKAIEMLKVAFDKGRHTFEWMHQDMAGNPLPAEVTLFRVGLKDGRKAVVGYTRDLRETKAAEAKMKEAEVRAKVMLDTTPISCSLWNDDFEAIDCNQKGVELFGVSSKQEFIERFLKDLSPEYQPDGRHSAETLIEYMKIAVEKGSVEFDWMHQTLGGQPFPVKKTLVRVSIGHKRMGIASYTRDLSQEKAAEAKILAAESRIQIMLDATPLCCNIWDEDLNNIDCNLASVKLFDLKNKQEYLDRFFDLSPEYQPDGRLSREKAPEMIHLALDDGVNVFRWVHQKLNGDPIPSEITLVRVDLGGGRKGVAGYTRDLRDEISAEAKIRQAEQRTQIMLDATPLGCTLWDEDLNVIDCNTEALKLFDMSDKQVLIRHFNADLSPRYQPDGQQSALACQKYTSMAFETGRVEFEWLHQKLNGEPLPVHVTLFKVDLGGGRMGLAGYMRDLREAKAAEASLKKASERSKLMFDFMPLGCTLWDSRFNIIDCNDEAIRLLGALSKQELIERFFDFSPEYQPNGKPSMEQAYHQVNYAFDHGLYVCDWVHSKRDGSIVHVELTKLKASLGDEEIVIAYMRDMTEIKNKAAQLNEAEKLAYTDPLTGVPNRRFFMEFGEQLFSKQPELLPPIGIIMFDIDHFKRVNDTYGHDVGDEALKLVSSSAHSALRETDVLARYGGEEFVVIVQQANLYALANLAGRILKKIEQMGFSHAGVKIPLTISAGVAIRNKDARGFEQVIKQADTALYRAKENGRNRVEVFAE